MRSRDTKQLQTHVGKVKSRTDIEYNETDGSTARAVVDREAPLDISFNEAEPPPGAPVHCHK